MIQVSAGQSLIDVCLQELGSLSALFDLADANGIPITALLQPGQLLQVPASALSRPEVAAYYAQRRQRVNVPDPQLPGAPIILPPDEPDGGDFLKIDFKTSDFK
jgi:hypothetical protein